MKRLQNLSDRTLVLIAILVLGANILLSAGLLRTSSVHAGASQNLSGYAWSSNIGWVSFNCTNDNSCGTADYGVNVDMSTGNFSGTAWSSSIGYISFNQTTGCPESGCTTQPQLNTGTGAVTGWARACEGTVNGNCTGASRTDGWDGWIKLSGMTADNHPYGVTLSGVTYSGFAWGGDVVGWLSWGATGYSVDSAVPQSCTTAASLSAAPNPVDQGLNVTLTWSVAGGSFCAASCAGSGFNTGGATSGSVLATVPPTPPSTSYALTCTGGTYGPPAPVNTTVTVIMPTVVITANGQSASARVNPNTANNTTIVWSSTNAITCAVTKNGASLSTSSTSPGVLQTVTAQTIYAIDCVNSHSTHATSSVIVNILSGFNEF